MTTRTVHDPFTGKDVQVSNRLTDRLRGKYACGPVMENGEPEFGWRQHEVPPVQIEAADRIEALEAEVERWHRVAMEAGAITCSDGRHIYPRRERIEQLEAALRLTRPYIEMHTLSPNGTMATILAKIDAALNQSSPPKTASEMHEDTFKYLEQDK